MKIKRWINEHPYMTILIAELIIMICFGIAFSLQIMKARRLIKTLERLLSPEMQMWHY